jgi:uncharacterized membrane protein YedE/YeeE
VFVLRGAVLIEIVSVLKGMAEFIALLLMGQGLVYLMSFGRHDTNAVYLMFRFLSSPVIRVVRLVTPNRVADKHLPFVGFFLLFWVWFGLVIVKASLMTSGVPTGAPVQ